MRKRIITTEQKANTNTDHEWLNLEDLAEVEITSEDAENPIESALLPGHSSGWRAAKPGNQTIRIIFTQPQQLKMIRLYFIETQIERTQEYVLRWSSDDGQSFHEIVRQQWNFNPQEATEQREDYEVELSEVTTLELNIIPDISGGKAHATLARLRLA